MMKIIKPIAAVVLTVAIIATIFGAIAKLGFDDTEYMQVCEAGWTLDRGGFGKKTMCLSPEGDRAVFPEWVVVNE